VSKPPLPSEGSQAYLWWSQGAVDEAAARDEGLSSELLDLRGELETLGRQKFSVDDATRRVLKILVQVHYPEILRRRFR
jgi:hypothetical protein